jgi:hypothetical protein
MQESGMRTAHLDEIVRQKDPLLRAVVEDLSEGKVSAIDNLKDQGRVHEIANPEKRIDTIAQQYAQPGKYARHFTRQQVSRGNQLRDSP